jgi:hypothetical protein
MVTKFLKVGTSGLLEVPLKTAFSELRTHGEATGTGEAQNINTGLPEKPNRVTLYVPDDQTSAVVNSVSQNSPWLVSITVTLEKTVKWVAEVLP